MGCRRSALLLCAAVLTTACASEAEAGSEPSNRAVAGPGTALGDGFRVARGSSLLGTVVPGWSPDAATQTWKPPSAENRWSAILRLTGNPIAVLNRYLRQGQRLGFKSEARCLVDSDEVPTEIVASPDDFRSPGSKHLRCEALGRAQGDDPSAVFTMEFRRRARDAPDEDYDDYLLLRVARNIRPFAYSLDGVASLPAEWSTGVPGPPEAPRVSRIGERVRRVDPATARPIRVVAGSRLVAPPGVPCSWRGGFDAVFEVNGNVDRVLDRYSAEFDRIAMRTERTNTRFRGQAVTVADGVGETGSYSAIAVKGRRGEPAYLHLWFCPTN